MRPFSNLLIVLILSIINLGLTQSKSSWPFQGDLAKQTYLTSSYAESRGFRYHTGWDYSTLQQEGFALVAPEDGEIIRLKVSPWGYGKVIYFRGQSSKKIYVLAHLSGFERGLEVQKLLIDKKSHTLNYTPRKGQWKYQKGQVMAYSGSSGIGSPHLHLEVRPHLGGSQQLSSHAQHADTLAPLLTAISLHYQDHAPTWVMLPIQNLPEDSISKSLMDQSNRRALQAHQSKHQQLRIYNSAPKQVQGISLRLVDYSYHLGQNPMSIASLKVQCQGQTYFDKKYNQLRFGQHPILKDLLWSRDDGLAGDWHYIPNSQSQSPWVKRSGLVECAMKNPIQIDVQDANHNHLKRTVSFDPQKGIEALDDIRFEKYFRGNQPGHFYSSQSKIYSSNQPGPVQLDYHQTWNTSQQKQIEHNDTLIRINIQLKDQALSPTLISLNTQDLNDSLPGDGRYFEWHPKGTPTYSKKSTYCYQRPSSDRSWGLYYQAESSLNWIYYSSQYQDSQNPQFQCVRVDELRDTRFLKDSLGPQISKLYQVELHRDQKRQTLIQAQIKSLVSFNSPNQIKVHLVNEGFKSGRKLPQDAEFVPIDWDPEEETITMRGIHPIHQALMQGKRLYIIAQDDQGQETRKLLGREDILAHPPQ